LIFFYWQFVILSSQGKTPKSSEWDFSIGESEGTGTFRSVSRPPQSRDKKTEGSYNQLTQRKALDTGYQGGFPNRSSFNQSLEKDLRAPYLHEQSDNQLEDVIDSYYAYLSILPKINLIEWYLSSYISKGEKSKKLKVFLAFTNIEYIINA
jgi:hypothetical protein